jgi:hypothetical protein
MPSPLLSHPSSDENEGDMLLMIPHSRLKLPDDIDDDIDDSICDKNDDDGVGRKATIFQTSLNVTKICMGTGTLALPFASEVGGLLFNAIGLFVIGAWNYYSADCLLRCLEYLPEVDDVVDEVAVVGGGGGRGREDLYGEFGGGDGIAVPILYGGNGLKPRVESLGYGTNDPVEETSATRRRRHHDRMPPPPQGTTAYGRVAWYASGPKGTMGFFIIAAYAQLSSGNGSDAALSDLLNTSCFSSHGCRISGLMVLDLLMLSLFIGLVIGE